ncbi:Zinc finger protein [Pseudolycoriella hygida]|uniref:Zinc finger protein n=1 Tax=Pseudolycoriella hygida TaxID=35572 RepID=A0A9Q0MKW2_9DIPT|nr:Zinc finger protein [Pseudolycoriella hygida]
MDLKLDIDPHSVCRICLLQKSPTNNLGNFFANTVVEGYIIFVPDMVQKCLGIESSANDGLPDKICDVCKKEITGFYLFKEKSARTEQILLTAFDKPVKSKERKVPPETTSIAIQTMPEHSFSCLECKISFKTEHLLSNHIRQKHSTKRETGIQTDLENSITEDSFIEEEPIEFNYKREMKMEALEVDDLDIDDMQPDMDDAATEQISDTQQDYEMIDKVQDEYQCNDCLEIFPQFDDIQNHKCQNKVIVRIVSETTNPLESDDLSENYFEELINEVDVYECYRCHATFNTSDDLNLHRNSDDCQPDDSLLKIQSQKPKVDEDHQCNLCHKRFKTSTTFNQHQKLHESIEIVIDYLGCAPCDDCHKIFLVKDHEETHDCPKKKKSSDGDYIDESCTDYQYLEQDSDFTCDICSMEFPNLNTAKQHVVTHAKEFVCPFEGCGCSYEIWSRFAMHLNTKHLNSKRYQCRFCECVCESFDSLQAHYKDECPEKKFKCNHCDKSYFSQKALNLHIKDITKGKTFNCTFCEKSFNRRGELELHNRSHTNERPYKCTICGKAYKTSSMRAAHMDAHIEGKTFPCTMCDKKLQTRTSYRNHMKRHTEEKKHQCEYCGKKFFTKFHVKLHASKIHIKPKTKSLKSTTNIIQFEYEDIVESMDDENVEASFH